MSSQKYAKMIDFTPHLREPLKTAGLSSASLSGNPLAGKPGFWWAEKLSQHSYQELF